MTTARTEHTPGRLFVIKEQRRFIISGNDGTYDIAVVRNIGNDKANAKRLMVCWNACEGLTTEAIQAGPPFAEMMNAYGTEVGALRAEVARLREAGEALLVAWGRQERFVDGGDAMNSYWSPEAGMIDSQAIAAFRTALKAAP